MPACQLKDLTKVRSPSSLRRSHVAIITLLAVALGLSACGRKGRLEAPKTESQTVEGQKQETGATQAKEDKVIILDSLL